MQKGYLLFGEPNWLAFHLTNSIGGQIVYCRGPGAPVKSLYPGDSVFCIRSGDKEHHVHLWGYFGWYEKLPIDQGWAKFGTSLGAKSEQHWNDLVSRLPALNDKSEFGAIVLQDVVAPLPPVSLAAVNIQTRRATKGRTLSPDEVTRLFRAMATSTAHSASYTPSGSDTRERVSRQLLARMGQAAFRLGAVSRYGPRCLVSGCTIGEILEAAHICPYRGEQDNHPENSLLLRCDLHTLFDLDLLGVEPRTLKVYLHPKVKEAGYAAFEGVTLPDAANARPSRTALAVRWAMFRQRLQFDEDMGEEETESAK